MTDINYEYAVNLQQNEGKWQERKEQLHEIMRYFTKNTILQFIAMDVNFRSMELREYIDKGDRGEFLASEIDRFISDFEITKTAYEKSGISASFAELARKITDQSIKP